MKDFEILLHKHNCYWQMDAQTTHRFVDHIRHYYKRDEEFTNLSYDELLYSEVDYEDILTNCMLFGAYFRTPEKLVLAAVHPSFFWTESTDKIKLNMCVRNGSEVETYVVNLCAK